MALRAGELGPQRNAALCRSTEGATPETVGAITTPPPGDSVRSGGGIRQIDRSGGRHQGKQGRQHSKYSLRY